ncbi:hypothetical protein ACEQPO_17125 [Bacillus sp. SL00103]
MKNLVESVIYTLNLLIEELTSAAEDMVVVFLIAALGTSSVSS